MRGDPVTGKPEGSRVVRPGDVPPADYARIRMLMGTATYRGRWGFETRRAAAPAGQRTVGIFPRGAR